MKILNPVTGNYEEISIKALDGMSIGMGVDYYGTLNNIPTGWLVCDGSAISRTEYAELFAVIGTQYGSGDGSTTFNLPNKCGKYGVGYDPNDSDFNLIGKTGGSKSVSYTPEGTNTNGAVQSHTLTVSEMPSHYHTLTPSNFHANTYNLMNAGTADQGGSWVGDDQFALAAARKLPTTNFPNVLNTSNLMQALNTDNKGSDGGHSHNFTQPTFTGTAKNVNVVGPYEVQLFLIKAKDTTAVFASIYDAYSTSTKDGYACSYINNSKQDTLVSGTNIKTLNNTSLIGSGNITVQERNYNIPIQSNLIFFGAHSFVKSEWREVQKLYSISCDLAVTPGCTRWVGMRAWTTDNGSSGTGVVIGWFDNAGNYKDKQWDFGNTWGSSSDWGSYKISGNTFRMSDLPSGWVVFKSIIPDASAGTAGTIKALYVDFYDVPTGVTPSILGS